MMIFRRYVLEITAFLALLTLAVVMFAFQHTVSGIIMLLILIDGTTYKFLPKDKKAVSWAKLPGGAIIAAYIA